MKGNVIRLNIMHLNSVQMNSIGEVQSVSLKAGESTEDPVYPPTTYTLAANVSNGKVTATKNGTAISLPYVATEGDVIVLSVTPDEGYEFKGWLDGNKSNPRTVTMTGNVVLSASCVEIAKPTYTLSASVTNGMVSAKRNGSAVNLPFTANEGDVIIVEVTPNDGYEFNGWADGYTDNPRSITMTADVVLSAECVEVVQPPVGNYIQFEDAEAERVLMSKGVSSDGVGITMEDAAKVTSIDKWFQNNTAITSFDEFEYFTGVTSLVGGWNSSAFFGCTNLRSIKFPPSITSLGNDCFMNCSSLAIDVDLPYLKSVGFGVFHGTAIRRIINLGNITTIGNAGSSHSHTFAGFCPYLISVELPSTLTTLGIKAFSNDTSLESIICRATTPPTMNATTALEDTNNCPIYVPDASVEAYRTATNWVSFADRIHPLSEIEGSPYIQFEDAEAERVLMAKGVSSDGIGITKEDAAAVTSIGTWFEENTEVTSFDELQYFTGVKNIVQYGLYDMTNLESVNLCNIQSVASYFIGKNKMPKIVMESLTTTTGASFGHTNSPIIILPAIETMNGSDFFQPSASIKMIMFGKSVQSIGHYAFWGFKDSTTTLVCLATTPPTLASNNNLGFMSVIYVPDASVSAYQSATKWSEASAKFKGISQLATDNPTLYAEIQQYL